MKKITIKSLFGNIIFEYEIKNNTLLKTLKKALKIGANLRGANLSGANLSGANLRGANLSGANLSGTNLRGTNLRGTNLSGTNLSGANLSGTNLSGANLSGTNLSSADLSSADLRYADLRYANLSSANLSSANLSSANLRGADTTNTRLSIYSKWNFSIENENLNIGCKTKTFSEWKEWFEESEEEFSTKRNTEDFKRLQAMFYAYEAYYNFLNQSLSS